MLTQYYYTFHIHLFCFYILFNIFQFVNIIRSRLRLTRDKAGTKPGHVSQPMRRAHRSSKPATLRWRVLARRIHEAQ